MATIAILGTMDTKGEEHAYLANIIQQRGHGTLFIDVGILDQPRLKPDVTRDQVAQAAGANLAELQQRKDRGAAVSAMAAGAPRLLEQLAASGRIHGVISLGGGGGTAIGTAAMRALPIGFPKVMVSTLASGNTAHYIASKDIVMFPSIVDVAGLNRVSRQIFARAAGAICGMVEIPLEETEQRPVIAASMFGNTTDCVQHARELLEARGYEVLVFHATGSGGRAMESVIESGIATAVLEITTTEWADEIVGGFLSAGPDRLGAAARLGIPAIVTPGCLDMVNFYGPESVPAQFQGRVFYQHNPQVTLMRTSPEECTRIGAAIAEKLNLSQGPVTFLIPKKAISVISAPGQPFHDPAADEALFQAVRQHLKSNIAVMELDCAINDPAFAEACVEELIKNLQTHSAPASGSAPLS